MRHGNFVHIGERDCSVQKPSHQKLLEEAPAPGLAPHIRTRLHEMAVAAIRAVNYTNAGTLEFLVSGDDVFFMEMNTRIQVEHPVTELVYNVDLVAEQIRVASGLPLSFRQQDLREHGHAIEFRINAEDPARNFAPAAGQLGRVVFPGGVGVRVDAHVGSGDTIPPFYDSMIAKILVLAPTRLEAIARMRRALRETEIEGIETTRSDSVARYLTTPPLSRVPYRSTICINRLPLQTPNLCRIGNTLASLRCKPYTPLKWVGKLPPKRFAALMKDNTDSDTRVFVRDLVFNTLENSGVCDDVITPLLQEWSLDRLPQVDRIILRMSVYELLHMPETPRAVVLNEAVELANRFSTEKSGRFINGVLGNVGVP